MRQNGAGTYTVYLSTWLNEAYLPISNVVSFYLPGDERPPAPVPALQPPLAATTTSPTGEASIETRVKRLIKAIEQASERLSESVAYREQEASLPRKLTIWMDDRGVINRSVGPADLEETITWHIGGVGRLGLNARYATQYRAFYQGPGRYSANLSAAGGARDGGGVSNEIFFSFEPASVEAALSYPPPRAKPERGG